MKNKPKKIKTVKIGIVGYGIVGQALAHGFSQPKIKNNYEIFYYDKYKDSMPLEEVVKKSEFIFICLPTPMRDDESGIDLSIIAQSIKKIAALVKNTNKIIIIKSTVIPGTTTSFAKKYKDCKFCFNPEFLTEANYLNDFLNADRTVVGSDDKIVLRRVVEFYKKRFPGSLIFETSSTAAEMVKYMSNIFLATKVIFANEIFDLCQKLGTDYDEVKIMVAADKRIGHSHISVTAERGFGQKCFPKDTVALLGLARKLKVDLSVIKNVWEKNKKIRKKHDWHEIPFSVSRKKAIDK
jgi:UDPglucose 6-dehydrogenase